MTSHAEALGVHLDRTVANGVRGPRFEGLALNMAVFSNIIKL